MSYIPVHKIQSIYSHIRLLILMLFATAILIACCRALTLSASLSLRSGLANRNNISTFLAASRREDREEDQDREYQSETGAHDLSPSHETAADVRRLTEHRDGAQETGPRPEPARPRFQRDQSGVYESMPRVSWRTSPPSAAIV